MLWKPLGPQKLGRDREPKGLHSLGPDQWASERHNRHLPAHQPLSDLSVSEVSAHSAGAAALLPCLLTGLRGAPQASRAWMGMLPPGAS